MAGINEGEVLVKLTTSNLRNLNSTPITAVMAPGPNRLLIPADRFIFFGNGAVVFSASIVFRFTIGTLTFDANISYAGDVDKIVVGDYVSLSNSDLSGQVNTALKITSAADVTLGAGSTGSFLVPYRVIDVSDLV